MAWTWRHTLAIDQLSNEWEKTTPTLIGERHEGSVPKGYLQRGILLALICYLVVDEHIHRIDGNSCCTLGYGLFSSVENSCVLSLSFFMF
jgi:hypothetical protein